LSGPRILIAHALDEEPVAELLSKPLAEGGYTPVHTGALLVGQSLSNEVSKLISVGTPVLLCGTVRAMGTGWAHRLVQAAKQSHSSQVLAVQMEREAYLDPLAADTVVANFWQNPSEAISRILDALAINWPVTVDDNHAQIFVAERTYRRLMLESCDIIDLANLPEMDRHIATRQLELRRLYVSLRVHAAKSSDGNSLPSEEPPASPTPRPRSLGKPRSGAKAGQPIGSYIDASKKLVVLGEPGSGKSTLLRWIATLGLLRLENDALLRSFPDVETFPDATWLPVLVRCRDLSPNQLAGNMDDVLRQMLRKLELDDAVVECLAPHLRMKIAAGDAILLIDGLDEISHTKLRSKFCRQLEVFCSANPSSRVIATSRPLGYRDMGYRLNEFLHVSVAELSPEDKDVFVRRWCALTEPPYKIEQVTSELIRDVHSTDRIERLTGNPMLLTCMALVRRRIGRLPSRRADLYASAVEVLLNWRPEVDEPIDYYEAIPQLEYLAYAMTANGVQRFRYDEVIVTLEAMRTQFPNLHSTRQHDPHTFLKLLEGRTGILAESGHVKHAGRMVPVYEFRHLTFQEYLTGLALVDGRYPERDSSVDLPAHLFSLTNSVSTKGVQGQRQIAEQWREALRLCISICSDQEVDRAVCALLGVEENEEAWPVANGDEWRERVILGTLCLSDEVNASEALARRVINCFVEAIVKSDGYIGPSTDWDQAATEISRSRWGKLLIDSLRHALFASKDRRLCYSLAGALSLCGLEVQLKQAGKDKLSASDVRPLLSSKSDEERCLGALIVMAGAFERKMLDHRGLLDRLLGLADSSNFQVALASSWAIGWLCTPRQHADATSAGVALAKPTRRQVDRLLMLLKKFEYGDENIQRFLVWPLRNLPSSYIPEVRLVLERLLQQEPAKSPQQTPPSQELLPDVLYSLERTQPFTATTVRRLLAIGATYPRFSEFVIRVLNGASFRSDGPLLEALSHQSTSVREFALRAALARQGKTPGRKLRAEVLRLARGADGSERKLALRVMVGWLPKKQRTALSVDADGLDPFIDITRPLDKVTLQSIADKMSLSFDSLWLLHERTARLVDVDIRLSKRKVPVHHLPRAV
jgi:hypothetical protein